MVERKTMQTVRGARTMDGAGVRLTRVLSQRETKAFDPFLMLDSFDSVDPNDYLAGFPMHPHRGIETVTYLIEGRIDHEDSLGNRGTILSGESQWMSAGSGILHQEMPKASGRMLGFQLWLNLPAAEKMSQPAYLSITRDMIPVAQQDGARVRVIGGRFGDAAGVTPRHVPATLLDVELDAGASLMLPVRSQDTAFVFLIEGDGRVAGQPVAAKTAALLGAGDAVRLAAREEAPARMIFFAGPPLREPIAWGGPIVMNTREELELAFAELDRGTFIRRGPVGL
ncbi:MAG: pirin family protein [Clostridiales bacterium]|nr:pirin family protein [Clostridiales bacterium]